MPKKISWTFDPLTLARKPIPRNRRREAREEIANLIKEEMLSDIGDGVSPVTGSSFPALSKEYKARKGEVASPVPNLELSGDLLDAFDVRVKGSQLEVGVFDGAQAGKADGNNRGTYGKTTRTRSRYARTFIPYRKDQKLSPRIRGAIKEVLEDYEE